MGGHSILVPLRTTGNDNYLWQWLKIVEVGKYTSITLDIDSREVQELFIVFKIFRKTLSDSRSSEHPVNSSLYCY